MGEEIHQAQKSERDGKSEGEGNVVVHVVSWLSIWIVERFESLTRIEKIGCLQNETSHELGASKPLYNSTMFSVRDECIARKVKRRLPEVAPVMLPDTAMVPPRRGEMK
jgi:hypothetical protein